MKQILKQVIRLVTFNNSNLYIRVQRYYNDFIFLKIKFNNFKNANNKILGDVKIMVPVERIKYANFNKSSAPFYDSNWIDNIGKTKGGDWDLVHGVPIEDFQIYKALDGYFNRGIDIRSSRYYAGNTNDPALKNSNVGWFELYEENYDLVMNRIEKLYNSIKNQGYKKQEELESSNHLDEIRVRIGREGEFLFENSLHRLVLAKLLGIKRVPVVVTIRHEKWIEKKELIYELTKYRGTSKNGELYQKLPHPDLENIPHIHDNDDRWNIIKEELPNIPDGKILDIGANFGFFSHHLAEKGYNVMAVESDPFLCKIMKILRDIEKKEFQVINADILDDRTIAKLESMEFSNVLALNIFHHFLKTDTNFRKFNKLLGILKTKSMIFQAHNPNEPQMISSYLNFEPDEFVQHIIHNSCLKNSKYLGKTSDERRLYYLNV